MRLTLARAGLLALFVGSLLGACSDKDFPVRAGSPDYAFEGVCVDVYTGSPIEGLTVSLSTGARYDYTTDSQGRFIHDLGLDDGITYVEIEGGAPGGAYHRLSQALIMKGDSIHVFVMIPVEAVETTWTANLLALLKRMGKFAKSDEGHLILAKWHHRPVPCYVPAFVNDHGVDYAEQARLAATRWMQRTSEPLFEFVDSPPDTGINIRIRPRSEMGINLGLTTYTLGTDGHPIRNEITVVDDLVSVLTVYKILLHEFGHTISLGHADDPAFLMYYGQPLPDDITDDEARVVRLHEALPTRTDMSIFDESGSPAW